MDVHEKTNHGQQVLMASTIRLWIYIVKGSETFLKKQKALFSSSRKWPDHQRDNQIGVRMTVKGQYVYIYFIRCRPDAIELFSKGDLRS